ncbi:MAG: TonB family protein [Pseudomonadota bacterium]
MIARRDFLFAAIAALALHAFAATTFLERGANVGDAGKGDGAGLSVASAQAGALVARWTAPPRIEQVAPERFQTEPNVASLEARQPPEIEPDPNVDVPQLEQAIALRPPRLSQAPALKTRPDQAPKARSASLENRRKKPPEPAVERADRAEPQQKPEAPRQQALDNRAQADKLPVEEAASAEQSGQGKDPQSAEAVGGAAGAADGAAARDALIAWGAQINRAVARKKRYPERARKRREQGVAPLRLTVARDGALVDAELVGSSGSARLDKAALAATRAAAPFEAAPPGVGPGPHRFTLNVVFKMR